MWCRSTDHSQRARRMVAVISSLVDVVHVTGSVEKQGDPSDRLIQASRATRASDLSECCAARGRF
jgi:hypothetical protein